MIATKKALPRRTVIRAAGATLALPLLDAMVPAFTPIAKTAARAVRRLGFVYIPNGAVMDKWTGFELFPKSIYGFDKLPALIVPRDLLLICGSAWLVCILGGLIPAWRAGRLKPVEALRYE